MPGEHSYAMRATWTGDRGSGTSGYRDYDRSVTLEVEGKPALLGSADAPFRGDPARWNPEDMLVAALSSCHMLSYLACCARARITVLDYTDRATATMVENGKGGGAFTEATLRPVVTIAQADKVDHAMRLHGTANKVCFIANSVNFPVHHEAEIRVAEAD